jgi:ABC-type multidrug transport system ATPase subunit
MQLTTVLQKVAAAGASVLFTIHQPASDIFESFDRIILLNKGRVMYQGSVEQAPDYFSARGYSLKPRYNPADFFLVRIPVHDKGPDTPTDRGESPIL